MSEMPDIPIQLDASFSEKVSVCIPFWYSALKSKTIPRQSDMRQSACNTIRRALYGVFMGDGGKAWAWMRLGDTDLKYASSVILVSYLPTRYSRDEIITATARETEFSALSMCSTQQGYKTRVGETVDMIRKVLPELLSDSDRRGGDEAFDDAQEILNSMHRCWVGRGNRDWNRTTV